jgi:hypothetical protein
MAEGEVFINGLGPGVPQWSTEKTLAEIKAILAKENILTSDVSKRIDNVAKGNAETVKVLRETVANERANQKATQKLTEVTKSQIQEEKTSRGIFSNIYKGIQDLIRHEQLTEQYNAKRAQSLEDALTKKYELGGKVDPVNARFQAKMDMVTKGTQDSSALGDPFQKTIKGLAGVTVAAEGFNAFLGQAFEDRFNLANEIRQTGLFAGLDSASSGLVGFAEAVRENNFTLGQAAEFTKTFARAVGINGVEASMKFVNAMAFDRELENGEKALGMMARFGMDFRQVSIMSGEYLDSLRAANMLGSLNERQMQQGMEDFMDGVQATSNVLKISLEESAKMISDRFQRDDVAGFLALLDDQKKQQTIGALANVGLNDGSALGEAIIKRIAMGGEGFMLSQERAQLMQTGQGAELVRLIEQVGMVADNGGDVQKAVETFMSGAAQMVDSNENNSATRAMMTTTSPELLKIFSEIEQFRQTISGITQGEQELTDADMAQVTKDELQRQSVVAVEGLVNTQMEAFSDNLEGFNTQTAKLIGNFEEFGNDLAPAAAGITRAAGFVRESLMGLANFGMDILNVASGGVNSATSGILNVTGAKDTVVGNQMTEAGESNVSEEKNLEQKEKTLSIQGGRESLENTGAFSFGGFYDNDAESMFDEIASVLRGDGTNVDEEAKKIAELIGFDTFNKNQNFNQEEFLRALEAIKTTDQFNAEGSQDKLQKLLDAINQLDTSFKDNPFFGISDENRALREQENVADKNRLISTIEQLIKEIRDQ